VTGHDGEATLCEEVCARFVFLLDEYGFRVVEDSQVFVRLESAALRAVVTFSRGEVDVSVSRLDSDLDGSWTWEGMVGTASLSRVLELAARELLDAPEVLRGDPDAFERLAVAERKASHEYTLAFELRRAREQAAKAWSRRDYRAVAEQLTSIREHLSPAELAKLRYARRALDKPGG
jgi:hypothetical protein